MADTFDPTAGQRYPYTVAVTDYLGGMPLAIFSDGTHQLMDQDVFPPAIYSPRLHPEELELFCKAKLGRYEQFYNEHEPAIENYDPIPAIEPFWDNDTE